MLWLASLAVSCALGAQTRVAGELAPASIPLVRTPEAAMLVPGLSISAMPAPAEAVSALPSAAMAAQDVAPSAAPIAAPAQLAVLGARTAAAGRADSRPAGQASALSASYDNAGIQQPGSDDVVEPAQASPEPSGLSAPTPGAPARRDEPPPPHRGPTGVKRYLGFLPNLLTGLNLTSGLASIMLLMHGGALPLAGGLIVLANFFDAFDGRAARWLGNHDPKGIEFDSLADVVSFGAAPALLIYKAAFSGLGAAALVPVALFAFAGLYRLGRFNIGALSEASGQKAKTGFFTGLPIPGGAGVIVSLVLALPLFAHALPAAAVTAVAVGVTLATAGAMVSTLPYPNFKLGGTKALVAPLAIGAALTAALAFTGHALLIPAAIFGAYLTVGPLIRLWSGSSDAFRKELKRKAFHVAGLLYIPALMAFGVHALPALASFVALSGLAEFARLKVPALKPLFAPFSGIIREKEAHRPSGFFYAALGVLGALGLQTFFGADPRIVMAGIAALFLADPVSPLIGLRFPKGYYQVRGVTRSWPGSLGGLAAAFGVALAFGFSWPIALGAAAAFSLVDILPVKPDDNLWIPIVYTAALLLLAR